MSDWNIKQKKQRELEQKQKDAGILQRKTNHICQQFVNVHCVKNLSGLALIFTC